MRAGQAACAGGGPQAASNRFLHSCSRCQPSGRCRVISPRPWRAIRAATSIRSRRSVAPRALAQARLARDLADVVEQWLSRGCACAVRRERQRPATALACRIAGCSPRTPTPLGAHYSTAGAGAAVRMIPRRFSQPISQVARRWAARGWARLTLIGPRLQSAVSTSLLHASPRRRTLQSRDADAMAPTVPRQLSTLSGRRVDGKAVRPLCVCRT